MEVSGQLHSPASLPPEKEILVLTGWVGPIAGVEAVEKGKVLPLPGIDLLPSNP
jgi:hypothetical protein